MNRINNKGAIGKKKPIDVFFSTFAYTYFLYLKNTESDSVRTLLGMEVEGLLIFLSVLIWSLLRGKNACPTLCIAPLVALPGSANPQPGNKAGHLMAPAHVSFFSSH